MMQRAVAAAALAHGESVIEAPSFCDDGLAALRIARALGATVHESPSEVRITGGGKPTGDELDCGEAGFSIRMFSAIASLFSVPLVLRARGSLQKRPMRMLEEPLRLLGAEVTSADGFPPLTIRGPIRGGALEVDGSTSSQFVSGLLMALPLCAESSTVRVSRLKSKPYVAMTLALLRDFGIEIDAAPSLDHFQIRGGQHYQARRYRVEGDWSGASFPLVAGAIAGSVEVRNLDLASPQADRAILEALKRSGASVRLLGNGVRVEKARLEAFQFNASECPDLFPPLVALAACCRGTTTISGALRLTHKESDRATVLRDEFRALGVNVTVDGDLMRVAGGPVRGGELFSHHDHRIAMAGALAGLVAESAVTIRSPECVAKSYPQFFEDLEQLTTSAAPLAMEGR